jgi:hypothetical protein
MMQQSQYPLQNQMQHSPYGTMQGGFSPVAKMGYGNTQMQMQSSPWSSPYPVQKQNY